MGRCTSRNWTRNVVVFGIVLGLFVSFLWIRDQSIIPITNDQTSAMVDNAMVGNMPYNNRPITVDVGKVPSCDVGVLNNPQDSRFFSIMLEDEALTFPPCSDQRMAASPNKSKVILIGNTRTSYEKGQVIHALVQLYDGYGNKKRTGGDLLRATIHDIRGYHHATGLVTDNLDGTHTVEIKAFWSGRSVIKILLAYTREVVSAVYRVRTEVLSTRNIYANFTSGKYSETTLCHPNRTRLLAATNNEELCDVTYDNSGMPFYCVKPKDLHLLCMDWMFTIAKVPHSGLTLTMCERDLFERKHTLLRQQLRVDISEDEMCNITPEIPCAKYDISKTWTSREPTGYFTGQTWNFLRCQGLTQDGLRDCMRNKTLYMVGDSTMRQWFNYMTGLKMNCTTIIEQGADEQRHKPNLCEIKDIGFKAGWYPHSQPFSVGETYAEARYTRVSIARIIDNIPDDEHAVVVFTLYLHQLAFHYTVTQGRLKIIRKAVENFLQRNKKSVVLIKGPHTFEHSGAGDRLNDCSSGLYTKLFYDAFQGLHDRVVLLNNGDATTAVHNEGHHPARNIVGAMVDQLFNMACRY